METHPINPDYQQESMGITKHVYWTDKNLSCVTRLRLLSDPGFPFWDVSYCQGRLKTGELVEVGLPFDQLPKRGLFRELVKMAKHDKVYAKGLGLLNFGVISTLN
jgi:hypothetical protein